MLFEAGLGRLIALWGHTLRQHQTGLRVESSLKLLLLETYSGPTSHWVKAG